MTLNTIQCHRTLRNARRNRPFLQTFQASPVTPWRSPKLRRNLCRKLCRFSFAGHAALPRSAERAIFRPLPHLGSHTPQLDFPRVPPEPVRKARLCAFVRFRALIGTIFRRLGVLTRAVRLLVGAWIIPWTLGNWSLVIHTSFHHSSPVFPTYNRYFIYFSRRFPCGFHSLALQTRLAAVPDSEIPSA